MAVTRSVVCGVGHYLPERCVPNSVFEETLDTTDAWIRERTGIEQRHFAAEGQSTSDLAIRAAEEALEDAGIKPADIDLIVLATSTPDNTFPSSATAVQAGLGITKGFAFDVQAVCAGFVYAMTVADALVLQGQARRALVIGSETFSRILDKSDRSTAILFGDGAGAVVLEAQEGQGVSTDRGILTTEISSDGRYRDLLYVDGGVSTTQSSGVVRMDGRKVFRHAVKKLHDATVLALAKANMSKKDIDYLVPHQANLRIINATAEKLGVPEKRCIVTVNKHANTSAASIPLALHMAKSTGRLVPGKLVVTNAIGGGLAWGSNVIRW